MECPDGGKLALWMLLQLNSHTHELWQVRRLLCGLLCLVWFLLLKLQLRLVIWSLFSQSGQASRVPGLCRGHKPPAFKFECSVDKHFKTSLHHTKRLMGLLNIHYLTSFRYLMERKGFLLSLKERTAKRWEAELKYCKRIYRAQICFTAFHNGVFNNSCFFKFSTCILDICTW